MTVLVPPENPRDSSSIPQHPLSPRPNPHYCVCEAYAELRTFATAEKPQLKLNSTEALQGGVRESIKQDQQCAFRNPGVRLLVRSVVWFRSKKGFL